MSAERRDSSDAGDLEVSLVRNDLLFRAQRAVGLIPAAGFGVGRRALLLALVTWLPIAAWAVLTGRALSHAAGEPLSQHFGIHVRCLVAIPLLVVAEVVAHARTALLGQHFVRSGIVAESDLPRFREIVRGVARLRDASLPWIAVGGILVAWTTLGPIDLTAHEIDWATESGSAPAALGFGGWWFLYVVRPNRLLTAPELGPVADTLTLYDAVKKMLPAPISRGAVSAVLVPAVLPLVAVLAIQIPLRDLLLKLLKALV